MPRRIEQVNDLLRGELAGIVNSHIELPDGLVTITYLNCTADLRAAKVGISVLPQNMSGTALKKLRKNNKFFSRELKKRLNLKIIPKFNFIIDAEERHAIEIEQVLDSLEHK